MLAQNILQYLSEQITEIFQTAAKASIGKLTHALYWVNDFSRNSPKYLITVDNMSVSKNMGTLTY